VRTSGWVASGIAAISAAGRVDTWVSFRLELYLWITCSTSMRAFISGERSA
jgi:hypothetical protein